MDKSIEKIKHIDFSKIIESGETSSFYIGITADVIKYLENNESSTFQEIVKYAGGSDRRILRLLDQMVKLGILKFLSNRFYLKSGGGKYDLSPSVVKCDFCESKVVRIGGKLRPLYNFVRKTLKDRPKPTFIFDQRPVNAETIVRRVAYMIWRGDVQGKRVVFIGDDDLTSLALAYTKVAKEIVVFDIDIRVLDSIEKISKKSDFKIRTVQHDFLEDTPTLYLSYFDTFVTDPTPVVKALTLFTNRGLEMLVKKKGKVGYISLYPTHMEKTIEFQRAMTRMDVLITDAIPFFNQYDFLKYTLSAQDLKLLKKYASHERKVSFCEHLMRIETTEKSRTVPLKVSAVDLAGRATKRILENPNLDPVLADEDCPKFLSKALYDLQDSLEKR